MLTPTQIFDSQEIVYPLDDMNSLRAIEKSVAEATIQWMEMIVKSHQEAINNYRSNIKYIQKNIWLPKELLLACEESKQPKMVSFIRNGNKQLIGYLPSKYFEKIPDEDSEFKFRTWHFLAKSDALPSEALKATLIGLSILECGMACQIARYGVLLNVLKEEKFNRLFGSKYGQVMNIGFRIHDKLQPMRYFVRFTKAADEINFGEPGTRPIKVGEVIGFEGVKFYQNKFPYGNLKAMIVICKKDLKGHQRFIGIDTPLEGLAEQEIKQFLLDAYNKEEIDPFYLAPSNIDLTQAKIIRNLLMECREKATLEDVGGYHPATPEEFISEIIKDLIELPLEAVSMDFVINHPLNRDRFEG